MEKQPILITDLLHYRMLSEPTLSKNAVSFIASNPSLEQNVYLADVYTVNLTTGIIVQTTNCQKVSSFDYLDDDTIVFTTGRPAGETAAHPYENVTVVYTVATNGGPPVERFRLPIFGAKIKKLCGTRWLLRTVYDNARPDFESMDGSQRDEAISAYTAEQDYQVATEHPFRLDGRGYIDQKRTRLYVYDESDRTLTPITEARFETRGFVVSPDKKKVAYYGLYYSTLGGNNSSIFLHDIESGQTQTLLGSQMHCVMAVDFWQDKLVFAAEQRGFTQLHFGAADLYTIDLATGRLQREVILGRTQDFGMPTGTDCRYGGGSLLKTCGDTCYYISNVGAQSPVFAWTYGKSPMRLTLDNGFDADMLAVSPEHLLVVGFDGSQRLQELYAVDKKSGQHTALTTLNQKALEGKYVALPQPLSFTNPDDGTTVDGWVLLPRNYDPAESYPAVLDIHGGPRTAFGTNFFHQMQVMASDGCFVLYCNPRGSGGKGDAFANIIKRYGTVDYQDLMRFTDLALDQYPSIDVERLGVLGGSYGGYMTNWIVTQTDRFKAAVSQRSISNLISQYTVSDIGPRLIGRDNGHPWSNFDELWQASPLKHAMNVKTPTLLIHSFEDYRCPLPEAIQFYTALQLKGVETRMCLFKGEGHELSRSGKPQHRIRRLKEITEWLYRFLGVCTYDCP